MTLTRSNNPNLMKKGIDKIIGKKKVKNLPKIINPKKKQVGPKGK